MFQNKEGCLRLKIEFRIKNLIHLDLKKVELFQIYEVIIIFLLIWVELINEMLKYKKIVCIWNNISQKT